MMVAGATARAALADWASQARGALIDWAVQTPEGAPAVEGHQLRVSATHACLTIVAVALVGGILWLAARWPAGESNAGRRADRLAAYLRDLAIDTACTLSEWRRALLMRLSYLVTVWRDPLGVSARPIPLRAARQYWRAGPDAFCVVAGNRDPKEQRFTAWLYRWHDAPSAADWGHWSWWANLFETDLPAHTLDLYRDGAHLGHSVQVELTAPMLWYREPTCRNVTFIAAARAPTDAGGCPTISDGIGLGALAPEQLIKDSRPPQPHGQLYAPPTRRPRRL
jgi:hypothetical protein